jgi:imidazolonepropionase-like amidohydrolase
MLLSPPPPLEALPPDSCDLGGVSVAGVPEQTISVRHGAIVEIREPAPSDDRRFAGCFVTPGLIDSHQHLPPSNALRLTGLFCLLNLMHGVTSVLDAGDTDASAVPAARRLIADELLPGPRVVTCGPFIARPPRDWPNTILLEDPVSPATVIQAAIDRGAQVIKLYEGLTRSDIAGLSAAAAERGLHAIGHVPAALDIEDAGVGEVQHFFGVPTAASRAGASGLLARLADWHAVDESRLETVVAASVSKEIAHTPTLVVTEGVLHAQEPDCGEPLMPRLYPDVVWNRRSGISTYRDVSAADLTLLRDSLPKKLELLARLHRAGVPLFLGTDVQQPYVLPGAGLHREMELFVSAGVAPGEVMNIATARAGARLGVPRLGTITAQAPADLLVLGADPSADIVSALRSLRAVVVGGRVLEIHTLREAVERQLRHFRRPLIDRASVFGARRTMRRIALRPSASAGPG